MASVQSSQPRRLVLEEVDWQTYTRLLRAFAERRSIRLTYDRGRLEIMSPLPGHETCSQLLGRFVVVLTEELGLPILSGGSTTFRRRRKRRGLEPDNCFWIVNEARVRGKRRINLKVDPPPDLALEVDVTRSSLNRMGIYAALKVPEVWRLENERVSFHALESDGKYHEAAASRCFPGLKPADLQTFLDIRDQMDENAVVHQFRDWVRRRIAEGWQ